jgi:hypothetical protein
MCAVASEPKILYIAEIWPAMSESPILFQPPRLLNSVKTERTDRCGAKHQSVTMTAKKARTSIIMRGVCMRGQRSWPHTLAMYTTST